MLNFTVLKQKECLLSKALIICSPLKILSLILSGFLCPLEKFHPLKKETQLYKTHLFCALRNKILKALENIQT